MKNLTELRVEIIEVRGEARVQKTRERMEGEIVKHNRDGTSRIRTDRGEMTVKFRGRDIPAEGQRVELDIPAGKPPRQMTVRPAPVTTPAAQTAQATQTTAQNAASTAAATTGTAQNTAARTSVMQQQNVTLPSALPSLSGTGSAQARPFLESGQMVRLLPLSTPQAQSAAQQIAATTATLTSQITIPLTASTLLPQKMPLSSLAQIMPASALQTSSPSVMTATPAPLFQPGAPAGITPQNNAPVITIAPSSGIASSSGGGTASAPAGALSTVLPATTSNIMASSPFLTAPTTPALSTNAALQPLTAPSPSLTVPAKLDALVTRIQAPTVTLTAPDAATSMSKPAASALAGLRDNPFMAMTPPAKNGALAPSVTPNPQGVAGSLTAQVTGTTPQNLPVLSVSWPTADGPLFYALQMRAGNMPPGTQIQIIPQGHIAQNAASAGTSGTTTLPPLNLPPAGAPWPLMNELYQTLQQIDPQALRALSQTLPQSAQGIRMPLTAFFFIAAARAGDLSGWLGDKTIDSLRRAGKNDLLDRLGKEFKSLSKTLNEPAAPQQQTSSSGEWRSMALPLLWGENVYKVLFHYHQEHADKGNPEDSDKLTRFIFDLELPRMGDVQLDGFHRAAQMDLIVRTHSAFSKAMQYAMHSSYITALEEVGLSGELSFQSQPEKWVHIDPDNAAHKNLA